MKYYVVADPHGFTTLLKNKLQEKGFFEDSGAKLLLCGDAFDRGPEAIEMQAFLMQLLKEERLIYIRGNHEDLIMELALHIEKYVNDGTLLYSHHADNGTVDTVCQLIKQPVRYLFADPLGAQKKLFETDYFQVLLNHTINYYETQQYIFVHGWIPCIDKAERYCAPLMIPWRNASNEDWEKARWTNGMFAWKWGVTEDQKTIVCGHYHTSWGHAHITRTSPELGPRANFEPFRVPGILALDGCVAYSGIMNCEIIEDEL